MALDDSGFRDGRRRHSSAVEVTVNEFTWQQEGWAPDMICGGIGDELLAPPHFEDFPWPENNRDGLCPSDGPCGMIVCEVTADGVPIEVGYDGQLPVAARIEVVNDVAGMEAGGDGAWRSFGTLDIGEGRAVALDPSRRGYEWGSRWKLPLLADTYDAEGFFVAGECLGIRVVRLSWPAKARSEQS